MNNLSFVEGSSSTSISMANEIHVLLVEHQSHDRENAKQVLEYFSYKVTAVELASIALTVLSKGKSQLDAVIANAKSPDSYAFKLVQDASNMGILVILVSDEDDIATTVRALTEGAFMCIKKPLQVNMAKYIWQHVLREKTRRGIERYCIELANDNFRPRNGIHISSEQEGNASRNLSEKNPNDDYNDNDDDDIMCYKNKKVWIEWTQDLHDKFIASVRTLGEGRCYPKDILELMNVPGLTRMQVASHLQKCRSGKWQPPNERKSKTDSNSNQEISNPSKNKPHRAQPMRFGSMPFSDDHYETSSLQLGFGTENPNQHDRDFVISQTTTERNSSVLETGVFRSAENTASFTDHHQLVYYNQHFAAEPHHQDYYYNNNHFTAGSSEEVFNNMGQLGLNNLSGEPFDMLDIQSSIVSNQSNAINGGEDYGFGFAADLLRAQNFSNSLQQELGFVDNNNDGGLSLQGFVSEQGRCYNQDKVTYANGNNEEFDNQMTEDY